MSFPRYPEYKDSGIEWLGEVPAHWDIQRLKHVLSQITERAAEHVNPVALENIEGWSGRYVEGGSDYSGDGIAFREGDLLFGKLRPYLAKVYLSGSSGEAIGDFHVMRPCRYLSAKYAFHQLLQPQFISVVDGATHGAKMPRVGWEVMGNMPFVTPPSREQAQITTFLDHETARIDALVEEQQRLIELLKEKRQAVISHAVTKGLDADVPMKDSGVEWLGEVPEHWELKRLGDIVEFSQGKAHEPFIDFNGEYICVNSRFVSTNGQSVKRCSENFTPAKVGDVLMVMSDLPNGRALARSFLVEQSDLYAVNQRVCRIRPIAALPLFLFYFLDRHPALLLKDDGFNQTHLSGNDFTHLRLNLPPEEEQLEIVKYLRAHTSKADELLAESNRNIVLLKERRSALISAAVTGKIDVRGWQPPSGSTVSTEATQAEAV